VVFCALQGGLVAAAPTNANINWRLTLTAYKTKRWAAAACQITGMILTSASALAAAPVSCNRACLEGYVDRYLDAMEANTVSPELFMRDAKFTENGVRLPLGGEGLWFRMSGKGSYRFYVPDIETQQVAFIGTAREGGTNATDGTPVAVVLRLKIVTQRISEVEQLVIRPETSASTGRVTTSATAPSVATKVEAMGAPHAVFREVIPEAQRLSREALIKTANYYFAGLQRNDGKGYYPFTDDCERFENGNQSTNVPQRNPVNNETITPGCKQQFEIALKNVVSRVRDRRFVAVDRERGIVFAFAFFDHENINWTWQLGELFKIQDGKIRRIEAVFHRVPYGINSGWSTFEKGMSDEPQVIR
jgi:hypothetical protein